VVGPESRGGLLGALVALELGVGLVELRKDPEPSTDSDRWLTARTPPDYQGRNLRLGLRRDLVSTGARVLFVDDWIDSGGQAVAARHIVEAAQATWCGASVIVDALTDARLRRDLAVSSIFRDWDLSPVP
jgi:adenine phosphoribosyltransferase